jgi:hypothetical protein
MSGRASGGAFPIPPDAFAPWQAAHSRANSFAPARDARSSASNGLCLLAVDAGAWRSRLPLCAQHIIAMQKKRKTVRIMTGLA